MEFKGYSSANRFRLQKRIMDMQQTGKTDEEIAETLGLTSSAMRSFAALFQSDEGWRTGESGERQSRLVYELWSAGKNLSEIGQMLNLSRPRTCQILHKHEWMLRHAGQRKASDY